ncbi:MAG: hypothetical protein MK078_02945 [Crocinitomicaceae bacterium]|nr:hypothetical protein [Crocinitomicaceae bacterium]
MNLGFKDFSISEGFKLKTLVSVEELTNYDMIYIYHHINPGDKVSLKFEEESLLGDLVYMVHYKSFKLGKIRVTGVMKSIYDGINELQAEVAGISKQKFLPFNGLDISIQAEAMKMVS